MMPAMDAAAITKRIDELIALSTAQIQADAYAQLLQGTTSILDLVYGTNSTQLRTLQETLKTTQGQMLMEYLHNQHFTLAKIIRGALQNVKQEINSGLIGSLQRQFTSEVLTDLIQLARAALDEKGDGAKNVAAVLAAAAFEDTIRRMGVTLAGIVGHDDLSDVLNGLKSAGVIQSPQIGIAQSYLSFRNHALHANWDKIQRESVQSVLGFVEQLLLRHF
jgi:hypothetical protein